MKLQESNDSRMVISNVMKIHIKLDMCEVYDYDYFLNNML